MSIVVDTPIWSESFRRASPAAGASRALQEAAESGEAILLGAVRQELLSGIRDAKQFAKLSAILRAFPNPELASEDYERAAAYSSQCRSAGIQGSNTDFLICSVAHRLSAEILTLDKDFEAFARILPVRLAIIQA